MTLRMLDSPEISDEALVKAFLSGEREAFAALYARYAAPIAGYIYNRFPPTSQDERGDLVQEVFAEALALLPTFCEDDYPGGNAFRRWLYNIPAGNVAFQHKKRYWCHREAYLRSVDEVAQRIREGLYAPEPAPMLPEQVRAAVEKLRPHYRQAIELYYLEGQSQETAATLMGRDTGSVRYLVRRALAELRDPDKPKVVRGQRRSALVASARTLLAERRPSEVSTEDLATTAGCSGRLIGYYFGSKKALFAEAVAA